MSANVVYGVSLDTNIKSPQYAVHRKLKLSQAETSTALTSVNILTVDVTCVVLFQAITCGDPASLIGFAYLTNLFATPVSFYIRSVGLLFQLVLLSFLF